MVYLRRTPSKKIKLMLSGPKSILPKSVAVEAPLEQTWYQLLIDEMGLQITPEAGLFVCTSRYTRNTPQDGSQKQWCANLDDQIIHFIQRFERKRTSYCVRLALLNPQNWNPSKSTPATPIKQPRRKTGSSARKPSILIPTQSAAPLTPSVSSEVGNRKRRRLQDPIDESEEVVESVSKQLMNLQRRNQSQPSGSPSIRSRQDDLSVPRIVNTRSMGSNVKIEPVSQPEPEPDWAANWDDEPSAYHSSSEENGGGEEEFENEDDDISDSGHGDDDDNLSIGTAATAEEIELRREGIRVEDVKSLVAGQFTRFSNAYMLRVRNEMRKLKRNNMWDRCVTRAPLASYLLQEIFKD